MRGCVLWLLGAVVVTPISLSVSTQFVPAARADLPDPETLFLSQCGTCHSVSKDDDPRQGPNLNGVVGRPAGTQEGFEYSSGFANAHWVWDPSRLDAWLTNPQALIKDTVMNYHQSNPAVRHAIIDWLKEQH